MLAWIFRMIPLAARGLALVAPAAGTVSLVTTFVATFVAPVALITAVSLAPSFLLFPLENSPPEDIEAMRQAELDAQVLWALGCTAMAIVALQIVMFFWIICAKRPSEGRGAGMIAAAPQPLVVAPQPQPQPQPQPLAVDPQQQQQPLAVAPQPLVVGPQAQPQQQPQQPQPPQPQPQPHPLVMAPLPQAGRGGDGGGGGGGGGAGGGGQAQPRRWRQLRWGGGRQWRQGGWSGGLGRTEEPLEALKYLDKGMVDTIVQEVDHIGVLEPATGPRSPPKGLLLVGPPGTGKSLIVKAIEHRFHANLFPVTASYFDGESPGMERKMVQDLFAVARDHQPAVIFVSAVDGKLLKWGGEARTQFFNQLGGAGTTAADRVIVIGTTGRPEALDEAARISRFEKRLYVSLPDATAHRQLINAFLERMPNNITAEDVEEIVEGTKGFSASDVYTDIMRKAAMGPVRELGSQARAILNNGNFPAAEDLPPVEMRHVTEALQLATPSVDEKIIQQQR